MLVTIYRSPTLGVATDYRKHSRNPTPQSEIAVISGAMGLRPPATVSTAGYRQHPSRRAELAPLIDGFDHHIDDGGFLGALGGPWVDGDGLGR